MFMVVFVFIKEFIILSLIYRNWTQVQWKEQLLHLCAQNLKVTRLQGLAFVIMWRTTHFVE